MSINKALLTSIFLQDATRFPLLSKEDFSMLTNKEKTLLFDDCLEITITLSNLLTQSDRSNHNLRLKLQDCESLIDVKNEILTYFKTKLTNLEKKYKEDKVIPISEIEHILIYYPWERRS